MPTNRFTALFNARQLQRQQAAAAAQDAADGADAAPHPALAAAMPGPAAGPAAHAAAAAPASSDPQRPAASGGAAAAAAAASSGMPSREDAGAGCLGTCFAAAPTLSRPLGPALRSVRSCLLQAYRAARATLRCRIGCSWRGARVWAPGWPNYATTSGARGCLCEHRWRAGGLVPPAGSCR